MRTVVLLAASVPGLFAQPTIYYRSIVDAASLAPAGLPAGRIARGSILSHDPRRRFWSRRQGGGGDISTGHHTGGSFRSDLAGDSHSKRAAARGQRERNHCRHAFKRSARPGQQ